MSKLKETIEIELLKEMTYKEINTLLNKLNSQITDLQKELSSVKNLDLGVVTVPEGTLRFHLRSLTKDIGDSHNYGFEDVLDSYLKRNAL